MWIKKIYKFYGDKNAPLDNVKRIEKALIISKVNKSNKKNTISGDLGSFYMYIIVVEFLAWFAILERIVGNRYIWRTFGLYTAFFVLFLLILQFWSRLKLVGDTIIVFEDRIIVLNWLYLKEIFWDKVQNIYFYTRPKHFDPKFLSQNGESKYQDKLHELRVTTNWLNIKIKGGNKTIYITTSYSHNIELQSYIKEKLGDKVKLSRTQGMAINQGGFLAIINGLILGPLDVGIVYLLNFILLHWHQIGFQWTIK